MVLFHFTSIDRLDDILREGINRGTVSTSTSERSHGIWLTTDSDPSEHGLGAGAVLSQGAKAAVERRLGRRFADDVAIPDKRAVRITVIIPSRDKRLVRWLPWAQKRCDPAYLTALIETGGGRSKAKTWYFYREPVPADMISAIELRNSDGTFRPWESADRAKNAEHS